MQRIWSVYIMMSFVCVMAVIVQNVMCGISDEMFAATKTSANVVVVMCAIMVVSATAATRDGATSTTNRN